MRRHFLLALVALLSMATAHAFSNWQPLTLGTPLSFTATYAEMGATFTLESDAAISLQTVTTSGWDVEFNLFGAPTANFSNPTPGEDMPLITDNRGWEGNGDYTLTAGTYYLYTMSVGGAGTVTVTLLEGGAPAVELNIDEILPADGATVSPTTNDGFLSLNCDFIIYASSWQIVAPEKGYTSAVYALNAAQQGTLKALSIYYKDKVLALFNQGFAPGDNFQIRVNDIHDAAGNVYGDGTLTLNYVLGSKPIDLASATLTSGRNKLLNYYMPGDESALVSFTFDGAFNPRAEMTVTQYVNLNETNKTVYGPVLELSCRCTSAAAVHYFAGTFSDDNRTATFDISGVDFGDWDGALGVDGAEPGFKILNIYDLDGDGVQAMGGSESTPGAYSFSTNYIQYCSAFFDSEWEPRAGSQLEATTAVTVYTELQSDDKTGVKNRVRSFQEMVFKAADGTTAAVPFADCHFEYTDAAEGTFVVSCATPEAVINAENVNVTLAGIVTCDNLYYDSQIISADFNTAYIDPTPYVTLAAVDQDMVPHRDQYIQSLAQIYMYTDLKYDTSELPTYQCSSANASPEVFFVNSTPSTDDNGKYYVLNIGQALSLTGASGAVRVPEGTTFKMSLPAKALSSDDGGVYGPYEYTFVFGNASGIIAVPTADHYVVYNMQGVKVLETADAAQLATLQPGVYLVNGHKVRIK